METNVSCSEDSFEAIYKCSCLKLLCPKHYFSHQENFPDHQIDRIKIDVNNESRQILTNLVITFKQKLIAMLDKIDLEFWASNYGNYQSQLALLNDLMHRLNLLLLFLAKTKYVFKKTFYTPFEYFLHQTPEKASKYASDFKFPEDIRNFFEYNYFKFEDKRYIFSFSYLQRYDNFSLLIICLVTIGNLLYYSEYEMAYEALQNLINIMQIANLKDTNFWLQITKIVCNFIKKRNTIKLIKQWRKIEANLSQDYYLPFYRLSECLFEGLNDKELVLYILEKEEIIMKSYKHGAWDLIHLGLLHFKNRNYKTGKKHFINNIRQFWNSSNSKDLNHVIYSCSILAYDYLYRCKNQRKAMKIANIVNKIIESYGKSGALDEALFNFYFAIHDWDNAHKIAWKLIKLYEKNQTSYLISSKSQIYILLAIIYRNLGYNKKSVQALSNAKSCCGILSINDHKLCAINEQFGYFYYNNRQYKDAVYCFEHVINYEKDNISLTASKFCAGMAHHYMKNYDRALQYFIEIENDLLWMPGIDNNGLFKFYSRMGKSYNCTNNKEKANYYFCKAFELLACLEFREWLENDDIFIYFLNNKDYEKCKAILQIWSIWVQKSTDLTSNIIVYHQWYMLYKQQNKWEEANKYWEKVEKLLDIEKISLIPKKQLAGNLNVLYLIAFVYIYDKKDFFKAEKILKIFESALDSHVPTNAWDLKILYQNLLQIYKKQNRLVEIKIYSKKFLNLLKLADQNEIWRENMNISKADIKKIIENTNSLLNI